MGPMDSFQRGVILMTDTYHPETLYLNQMENPVAFITLSGQEPPHPTNHKTFIIWICDGSVTAGIQSLTVIDAPPYSSTRTTSLSCHFD
ncbi:hypothetical protein BDW42DRAFT_173864 [Aspergillus taichungensis]|uniref:Uncharacterized protein n=1 Tax=Aspergillus taichungensis TaxID=482145 RepID=A0A2J5HP76_9EURO|nr:hypothetical protein BDW42DRAFT_173864 [Aspergillus taichungensis]